MPDPDDIIEPYLLAARDWVSSELLVSLFHVTDRQLRGLASKPGILSHCAISGDKGFKHVACASTTEWLRFKHRIRRHAISELVRVRDLGRRRNALTRQRRAIFFERDTPQSVMSFSALDGPPLKRKESAHAAHRHQA